MGNESGVAGQRVSTLYRFESAANVNIISVVDFDVERRTLHHYAIQAFQLKYHFSRLVYYK